MSRRRVIPELSQSLPPSPLLPFGHRFAATDRPVVTPWGEILPPTRFSREQRALLGRIARGQPPLGIDADGPVATLATYLDAKLTFGATYGCWNLPLKTDHDTAPDGSRRARYPTVSVAALGYQGQLAHRATIETFAGVTLEGRKTHVDHRCRDHSCCNPCHLEAVTAQTNNLRGVDARRHELQPMLTTLEPGDRLTYGQLAIILADFTHDTSVA